LSTKARRRHPGSVNRSSQRRAGLPTPIKVGGIVLLGIVALVALFYANNQSRTAAGQPAFAVGKPGPGEVAPTFVLASTAGGNVDLSSLRGRTVLLYFQEGVDCQPCWDQLKDIEGDWSAFQGLGIDQMISITGDPLSALKQKVTDEALSTPVLSDPNLSASKAYHANSYGMMGTGADGHSFLVVGPDGLIRFRADYGGAPNYTMYVKVSALLAQLRQGLKRA
jgi:peroxiredoxin